MQVDFVFYSFVLPCCEKCSDT